MSESGLTRQVHAGSHLYMMQKGRTAPARILAKSQNDASVTISVDATEDLKNFDVARFWSPVTIDATNDKIDFVASSGGPEINGSVAHGVYDDPHALAFALRQALHYADVGTGAQEYFVEWDSVTDKFTIRHIEESLGTGDFLSILWKTGVNGLDNLDTHIGSAMGFSDAADDTGATSYEGDTEVGSAVSWASKPNLVVPAQGMVYYDVPAGAILRFIASAGVVELTFYGSPGFEDPQPVGRFNE